MFWRFPPAAFASRRVQQTTPLDTGLVRQWQHLSQSQQTILAWLTRTRLSIINRFGAKKEPVVNVPPTFDSVMDEGVICALNVGVLAMYAQIAFCNRGCEGKLPMLDE